MSELDRSEVEAALAFYGDPDSYTGHEQAVLAAARAWLSTPTEPTDEEVEAAAEAEWETVWPNTPWDEQDEGVRAEFMEATRNGLFAARRVVAGIRRAVP